LPGAGGLEEHAARALTNLAAIAAVGFDLARADRYLGAGIAYCTEHDLDSWILYLQGWHAAVLLQRGRWAEATQVAARRRMRTRRGFAPRSSAGLIGSPRAGCVTFGSRDCSPGAACGA